MQERHPRGISKPRNRLDRFHRIGDAIDRVPPLGYLAACTKPAIPDRLIEHEASIARHGDDMPGVEHWHRPSRSEGGHASLSDA